MPTASPVQHRHSPPGVINARTCCTDPVIDTGDPAPARVGSVVRIRRYPVKSLLGETLNSVRVDDRGLAGDRLWAVRGVDGKLGSGKSTRRFRQMEGLLGLTAVYAEDTPTVRFPDGRVIRADEPEIHRALSLYVGEPVTLARENQISHFDEGPLHLLTTASLRYLEARLGDSVDERRFRANVLVDTPESAGPVEDTWIGRTLTIGNEVIVRITRQMTRCVMVNNAQDDLPRDSRLLKTISEVQDMTFGVLAHIERPGAIQIGDPCHAVRSHGQTIKDPASSRRDGPLT